MTRLYGALLVHRIIHLFIVAVLARGEVQRYIGIMREVKAFKNYDFDFAAEHRVRGFR